MQTQNSLSRLGTILLVVALASGCTYVRLSDKGYQVAQAHPADVLNCEKVGIVSAQTAAKVVLKRDSGKIHEELTVLARNQAADLGANAIVPIGVVKDGGQTFNAYRCSTNN